MSFVFLVSSQSQLSDGLPWVERFAQHSGQQVAMLVAGMDRKTLLEHVRRSVEKQAFVDSVEPIVEDLETVVTRMHKTETKWLVMIDDHDDDHFQASVFERSPVKTLWINAKTQPPAENDPTFVLDDRYIRSVERLGKRLLGIRPSLRLADVPDAGELADQDDSWKDILSRESQRCDPGDLICVAFDDIPSADPRYPIGRALLRDSTRASVMLISGSERVGRSIASRIRYWATHVAEPMDRDARVELSRSLTEGSQPNLEFLGLISASAMLAAFGLLQDSAAVIIGAMLIAPLMTPILGAGMALTHGNRPLFQSSLITISIGFLGALASSFLFGCLVRLIQEPVVTPEMWARCQPSPLDFCVGLVGGMAASYARTRSHLSSALAGAAIAAALVPPISTAGLEIAFGVWEASEKGWPVFGPLLLVSVNVLTIMIGSSFVLYARGMRIDRPAANAKHGIGSEGQKWATRMTALLVTLVLLVLVWIVR